MGMTNRERVKAILNYEECDRLPIVHFGFWKATLEKWKGQGHVTAEEADSWFDESPVDKSICGKLGFDFNWNCTFRLNCSLYPEFEREVVRENPDGTVEVRDRNGVLVLEKRGVTSIPSEIDHLLKDRRSWEEHYLPRLRYSRERVYDFEKNEKTRCAPFDPEGLEYLRDEKRGEAVGLHLGSLLGEMRNWLGIKGLSYLYMDDERLYDEIIDTVGELSYECTREILSTGAQFDFAHFWEDICFKNGPLVDPSVFEKKVGPHYKRVTDLVSSHGINIVSVDCDGMIDSLIPTWIENGVNTMFPIEVGTWKASIKSWREKYGKRLLGVGGMDKNAFSKDYSAVDSEIERLKPLVELGGYIPCPDHRIAPDAEWDNVKYYCEKMRETF